MAFVKSSDGRSALLDSQLTCKVGSSLIFFFFFFKQTWMGKAKLYVCGVKNRKVKSKCKPRCFIFRKTLPVPNTCLVYGWISAGFLQPCLNIYKRFSRSLVGGVSSSWLNISVGTSFFVYPSPQSSLATGPRLFLTLNYHASLGPLWKFYFFPGTNINGKGKVVCVWC